MWICGGTISVCDRRISMLSGQLRRKFFLMAILGGAILVPLQGFMSDGQFPEGDFFLNVVLRQIFTPIKTIFDHLGFHHSMQTSYSMPLVCFAVILLYGLIAHRKENEVELL